MLNRKFKSGILTQLMEGGGNSGQREQYVTDDSPSPVKPSARARTSDADGHTIPETNLNVSTLHLSYAKSLKDLLYKCDFEMLFYFIPFFPTWLAPNSR